MARSLVERPITTRASRASLAKGTHGAASIRMSISGIARAGVAVSACRWYTHRNRCYKRIDLVVADDVLDEGALDFNMRR